MPQKTKPPRTRKKTTRTPKRPPEESGSAQSTDSRENAAQAATKTVEDLLGQSDKFGSILTKGLDLAEAGISLGLNLLNRVGSMTQENLIDRITAPFGMQPQQAQAGQGQQASATAEPGPEQPPPPSRDLAYISNRLPVLPGQECRISFSINNDSHTAPKKVKLQCEGFVGERTAARFDATALSIHPASKSIEPMDFEKFVLSGMLPAELPSDVYQGWIVVSADTALRIPVRIVVSESL